MTASHHTSQPAFVIAIDGPAASGKGTLARRLAAHYGYAHLDTGLLYRVAGLKVLQQNADPADAQAAELAARGITLDDTRDAELRSDRAAQAASKVAAIAGVRAALLDFQRAFATTPPNGAGGAVLDGRDIGSVVCPDASVKLFVTADMQTRAERRWKELLSRGTATTVAAVLEDLRERDARDSQRAVAPLTVAPGAFVLDTSGMTPDEVLAAALALIDDRRAVRG
jgi:CMP/dCMP kinase